MIRICVSIIIISLHFSTISAQSIQEWQERHAEGKNTVFEGVFNECLPYKAVISEYPDSTVGIWQIADQKPHLLQGSKRDNVMQLIETDMNGETTGYFFYRANAHNPNYAYWISSDRSFMRMLPIKWNTQSYDKFKRCNTGEYRICLKQKDPHTAKGLIIEKNSQLLQRFTLSDSLYLNSYNGFIPERSIHSNSHRISKILKNCIETSHAEEIQLHSICDIISPSSESKYSIYVQASWPREIHPEMKKVWKRITTEKQEWLNENVESIDRFQSVLNTDLIPFYMDDHYLSFILKVTNVDGSTELLTMNYDRKSEKRIHLDDIFKNSFELETFREQKASEARKTYLKKEPQKTDFIKNLEFPHVLISKNGFIFLSEEDKNLGWRTFFIPYSDLKGEYQWFHPIKKLLRDGN